MNLLDRIKELAHKRGISITQLEEELNIPKTRFINGKIELLVLKDYNL